MMVFRNKYLGQCVQALPLKRTQSAGIQEAILRHNAAAIKQPTKQATSVYPYEIEEPIEVTESRRGPGISPAVDAVSGRDDLGRLVRALRDGRPYPAVVLACAKALELERGARRLAEPHGGEAVVDGSLGDRVGAEEALPLVDGLPRAHQEVAVRKPLRGHAEQPAGRGGRGRRGGRGEREGQRRGEEEEVAAAEGG
jgi:hypothetical protein